MDLIGSEPARTIHSLTRFIGHKDLKGALENEKDKTEYAYGILFVAFIGCAMFCITLLWCICFYIGRCCCPAKSKAPNQSGPFLRAMFVVFAVIIGIFCVNGYVASSSWTERFSGSDTALTKTVVSLSDEVSTLLDSLHLFAVEMSALIIASISKIRTRVSLVVPTLTVGTEEITEQMQRIEVKYAMKTINDSGVSFPCEFCKTISEQMRKLRLEVKEQTSTHYSTFNRVSTDITKTIVDIQKKIISDINTTADKLFEARKQVNDGSKIAFGYLSQIEQIDEHRQLAFSILFAVPLFLVLISMLSIKSEYTGIFGIIHAISFLTMLIIWLLFAFHAPAVAVLSDVCVLLDDENNGNWTILKDKPEAHKVLTGCFAGKTIIEIFELTKDLEFRDQVTFPDLKIDVDAIFNFSVLDTFSLNTKNLTTSTFEGTVDDLLQELNKNFPDGVFTRDNIDGGKDPLRKLNSAEDRFLEGLEAEHRGISPLSPGNPSLPPRILQIDVLKDILRGLDRPQFTTGQVSLLDANIGFGETESEIDQQKGKRTKRAATAPDPDQKLKENVAHAVATEERMIGAFQELIEELKNDTDRLKRIANETKMLFIDTIDDLYALEHLIEPIFEKVDNFANSSSCNFVSRRYNEMYQSGCVTMLGSLGSIAVSLFLIGIFLAGSTILAMKLGRQVN